MAGIFKKTIRTILRCMPTPVQRMIRSIQWENARLRREHWYLEWAGRQEFFRRAFLALQFNEVGGDYAEFGCWRGQTFTMAYEESRRAGLNCKLWAFDSFTGLPPQALPEDEHPKWIQGTMHTSLEEFHAILKENGILKSAYEVVPGYYDVTLAPTASDSRLPADLCMAYVDCDLYSSTSAVLKFLLPRLKHGMILAFDDYFCYSSRQLPGERRACNEVFNAHPDWQLVPYIQYGWHGMSFFVESKRLWPCSDAP
jgi:hypothetical protein